ncbi:MAG TPA: response regulator [Thermoanaerobaculia bacterium]|nr:response regulator [Thermoanaerobaculia bacterium]
MDEKPVILVVDDDGPILALMRNLLKEFGFQAVTAESGSKALEAARNHRPALVLLDKNMPGMPGEEIIRTLRAEPGWETLPILILSGERMSHMQVASIGADGAVQKPFDVMSLIEQIRAFVSGDGEKRPS